MSGDLPTPADRSVTVKVTVDEASRLLGYVTRSISVVNSNLTDDSLTQGQRASYLAEEATLKALHHAVVEPLRAALRRKREQREGAQGGQGGQSGA